MKFLHTISFLLLGFSAYTQSYEVVEVTMSGSTSAIREINTEGTDFAPFVSGNKLYFTSSREFDLVNIGENNWKNGGYLNVYSAEFKDGDIAADSRFKEVELTSEKLKTDSHTGPVCFSVTGDTMFYTQVIVTKNKGKKNKFRPQLFMATRDGDQQWTVFQSLPFNDESASFGHPSYDSGNKRLYFSTDLAGGQGGKDIYYSELVNGTWSAPVNMKDINTESNDLFPFFIEGHLFFSSDRAGGQGGLDIYWKLLQQQSDSVQTIQGLNTAFDEFGIFIFPGMKTGYLSSNQSGNDDIYFLNLEKKVTVKNELAGMFTYRNLNSEASDLKIQIINSEDDMVLYETNTSNNGEFVFRNLNLDGNYSLRAISEDDLNLVIYDKDGNPVIDLVSDEQGNFTYKKLEYASSGLPTLIPENMQEDGLGHLSGQLIFENVPGEYPANVTVVLYDESGKEAFRSVTDNSGNFDFRQLSLTENYILKVEESIEEEMVLLVFDKYGSVVAQLKSNQTGEFVYRKLSNDHQKGLAMLEEKEEIFELETQTIAGYFEYKKLNGISAEGLTIYAYDDDGILLSSTQTDEKGQFRFRSLPTGTNVLFKIDENDPNLKLDDFTLYIFDRYGKKVAGLSRGQNGYFIYKPLGFENSNLATIEEDSLNMDLALTTNYDIVKVYFDSNQSNVKSSDTDELDKLYKLLKANPNLRMEINAYADSRASDDYNLLLSKKRGEWIVDYMIKKGIPASRLIINAYGETKIIDAANDAVNRRAEIRVY